MIKPGLYSIRGMTTILSIALALFLGAGSGKALAETLWNVGVSGDERGITGFDLSVGEYYDVPEREVVVIRDRGIDDEDLPVVFFLSRHARVAPGVIVDLRLRGMSWMDITLHYGLGPEIYYVPVTVVKGHPPYGRAYGYYKKHPHQRDWKRLRLKDREIVDQVNLRFMTEHYRHSPEKVMQYREKGRRFPVINRDIWRDHHSRGGERYIYGGRPYKRDLDRDREYIRKYYHSAPQKSDRKDIKKYDRSANQKRDMQTIKKIERTSADKRGKQDIRNLEKDTSGDRGGYRSQPQSRNNNKLKMEEKNDRGHDRQGKRDKD